MPLIEKLIDKHDNFEVVRDKIVSILRDETIAQQALAVAGGKDPSQWKLEVYAERSNPWEKWLNSQVDRTPIVNVWLDNLNFNLANSNAVNRQKAEATYNIDCYGFGLARDVELGGHISGDKEAAYEAHRTTRLVRNILMSAYHKYLDLQGVVWGDREIQSITGYQPELNGRQIQQVYAVRIKLGVAFNEFSPQFEGTPLKKVTVAVNDTEDDKLLDVEYNY